MLVHTVLASYALLRMFRRSTTLGAHNITFSEAIATAHTAAQVYEDEIQYHDEQEAAGKT